jgi:hypothetical protein
MFILWIFLFSINFHIVFGLEDSKIWKISSQDQLVYYNDGTVTEMKIKKNINYEEIPKIFLSKNREEPKPLFSPTIFADEKEIDEIFNQLRADYKRNSECSDRAHIWAYDLFKEKQIFSKKIFIFFTASYINREKFKWWFHVAPLLSVKTPQGLKERVLDFRYAQKPLKVKEWTDLMVHSGRSCKETTLFSEYDVNPQTEDCYLIKESMYYRLPGQIFEQETKGKFRTQFFNSELKFSLKNAFHQDQSP